MKTKVFLTFFCFAALSWGSPVVNADPNRVPDSIETHQLTGLWVFDKAEILEQRPNAQALALKTTIDSLPGMYDFSFCFYHALLRLHFDADNRLMFERVSGPATEGDYQLLRDEADGQTRLEIFVPNEEDNVPIPLSATYRISLEGADRLTVTTETGCLNGEVIVSYFKRSI
jgi:hypothetical protein